MKRRFISKFKHVTVSVGFLFMGLALTGWSDSYAQRKPSNQKNSSIPSPTPPKLPDKDLIDEEDEIIDIDTEVVNVLFTAQDKKKRLLTDLKEDDVKIFENGKLQKIISFSRKVDLPLSLTILLDTSYSQIRTLPQEKEAAKSFLKAVVRPEKDEVAIVSFTGEATLEQGMTNNVERLRQAIDRIRFVPPSGHVGGGVTVGTPPISDNNRITASTAIWDALWVTSKDILGVSPAKTRRAIILLTDGENTYGMKKLHDAVQETLKAEAVIYSIGIGDNFYGGINKGALIKVSESTGGKAFFPRDEDELRSAFGQIQKEMRSQYLLVYEPLNRKRDGTYRRINIKITNPVLSRRKVKLAYRDGYFAKTSKKN